ncbi:MAG: 50S ribosomal protein L4 [Candidatus Eremiobacter antarcticus]|nr:50S ribosomal protein L4 [Candidatus Eremiobacteraeota bacterium]MBC5807289.1 50S ribosomal protein L4 [Candidatus Eremiobacteraeota bacterium]PZR61974.1 MAG: 50S ribosomal protein L4 [Candidatus Eremiobacter sp. RRmetagenome_bin22]
MGAQQLDKDGKAVGAAELPAVFAGEIKPSLLHSAVIRHLANRRAGTASTKKRDEVAGGGRKPWRQKGTGRARQGSIRSPLWRKGGVVFGPHPRSFAVSMNKRTRRAALAMAIAAKAQADALAIVDADELRSPKTKELAAVLWAGGGSGSVLLALDAARDVFARQIYLAGRNVRRATVVSHDRLSVHALLSHDRVILTKNALDALAEVCSV